MKDKDLSRLNTLMEFLAELEIAMLSGRRFRAEYWSSIRNSKGVQCGWVPKCDMDYFNSNCKYRIVYEYEQKQEPIVRYVNMYPDGSLGQLHSTKRAAKDSQYDPNCRIVRLVEEAYDEISS
jgi:hypothetical protein